MSPVGELNRKFVHLTLNFCVPRPYRACKNLEKKCMQDLQRMGVYTGTLAPAQELFLKNGSGRLTFLYSSSSSSSSCAAALLVRQWPGCGAARPSLNCPSPAVCWSAIGMRSSDPRHGQSVPRSRCRRDPAS